MRHLSRSQGRGTWPGEPVDEAMAHDNRWANLVNTAFLLDQSPKHSGPEGLQQALTMIQSALEVFPSSIDPVEDFEGYAVRRLLLSLLEHLRPPRG